ncbi:MAG TPA: ATP-binding protein [Vicinamibacterales bacterium]|nr:ATP-binding protein [Vicinamibacterales bacterium]
MAVRQFAIAVAAVAAATAARIPIQPLLGDGVPYLLYFPTVALCAWYGGGGAGVAATLLSAAAAQAWFTPGRISDPTVLVPLLLFVAAGSFISALTEALHRAERRAYLERSTLAATLLSIGDGVIVTDAEARLTMMNAVAEQLTGWSAGRAAGRQAGEIFRVIDETTRAPLQTPIQRALREGVEVGLGTRTILVSLNGTEWPIDDSAAPIRGTDGRVIGGVLVFRQIVERRRAEAARETALSREKKARMEAEAASRLKDEFLATLSHELRTPLNAILGWTALLADQALPEGRREHALRVIHRNAEAQTALIEQLLDMSKFMTGKLQLSFEPVSLPDVAEEAVDAVRLAADARQQALAVVGSRDVPPVGGDRDRLRQLVWNLLSNAVKFTPQGGRISVLIERAGPQVLLRVSDTGPGIDRELMPRVFERFVQGDASPSRVQGGLGLGLALVKHIAEAHGGSVDVTNGSGGTGAIFTVALPVFAGGGVEAGHARGGDGAQSGESALRRS